MSLIEDEDGAPYPEVWAIDATQSGLGFFIPYPGAHGAGSREAAEHWVRPNVHLGWKAVHCQLVPVRDEEELDGIDEVREVLRRIASKAPTTSLDGDERR